MSGRKIDVRGGDAKISQLKTEACDDKSRSIFSSSQRAQDPAGEYRDERDNAAGPDGMKDVVHKIRVFKSPNSIWCN